MIRSGLFILAVLSSLAAPYAAAADVQSVSRIAFGPADTLFVADWKAGRIYAFTLPPAQPARAQLFNLTDAEDTIRKAAGATDFELEDLAMRPQSSEAYIALVSGPARKPAILMATPDGKMRPLALDRMKSTSVELRDQPDKSLVIWDNIPGRSFTVTDMQWYSGKLYIAGLSNQAFSSTLRILHYPFTDHIDAISVEMYHTIHNQVETRAPIRAMSFTQLGGKPYLLAAYLCTPLVTIPVEDLKPGAHVKAKTIAELGAAGIPVNVLTFQTRDNSTQKMVDQLLVVNLYREAATIALSEIEQANQRPGLSQPVQPYGSPGPLKMTGVPLEPSFRVVNFNDEYFLALRRNLASGHTQLVNYNKAFGFRLSDFDVSEFLLPGYTYAGFQRQMILPMQNQAKTDEGFPQQVRK